MAEQISREKAKQLIEESDKGVLVKVDFVEVPVIGDLPEDEKPKMTMEKTTYEFGDYPDDIEDYEFQR